MSKKIPNTGKSKVREVWSSQTGFLMAAIGSAIGLGNIWRFPGTAYKNGGGAFIIPYLVSVIFVGVTILLLDYALGHYYRGSAPTVFRRIHRRAEFLGWWQVLVCFVIMTYYVVIVAWSASYSWFSINMVWGEDPAAFFSGDFLQLPENTEISTTPVYNVLIPMILVWVAVLVILALGVNRGLERANKIFLPLLVVLFIILVLRALALPGATSGLNEFFTPDWVALTNGEVWIAAFGQVFFSLSVGFGIMLTYVSYLPRRANLGGTGMVAAFANSGFELLAGIGVFATLGFMANQQNVGVSELEGISGIGLSFITFPTIISMMPGGPLFGVLFFVSLTLAGVTSLLSLLQMVSGAIQDKFGLNPRKAALAIGVSSATLSVVFFATQSGLVALDVVDAFINDMGVVSSAIVMCVLVAVVHPRLPLLRTHLNMFSTIRLGKSWNLLAGFIIPATLLSVLMSTIYSRIFEGYGDYPGWFVGTFGWAMLGLALVAAFILTLTRWQYDPETYSGIQSPLEKD